MQRATWRTRPSNPPGRASIFRALRWKLLKVGNSLRYRLVSRARRGNGSCSLLSAEAGRKFLRRAQRVRGRSLSSGLDKIAPLEVQRHADQCNHDGHFDEWADDGSECRSGVDAENGNCNCNREFKVVRGRGEREGGRLRVGLSKFLPHVKRQQ